MQIAVYSGSFNPVHLGHTALAGYLTENQLADEVWFVVSPCNPLKEQKDLLDEYLRLDMLMLAIEGNQCFKASDIEFSMPIPSYSIDTLNKLKADYPEHSFKLIIGSDNALIFNQWKKFSELLNNYEILVYPRQGYDFEEVKSVYPQMTLLNTPFYNISSTEIRQLLDQKKDVSQLLHPKVLNFIDENELYSSYKCK